MVTLEKFKYIKNKYGLYASWAVWDEEGDTPKSNVGNLEVLDPKVNDQLIQQLNSKSVLVALNISRGAIQTPLANFHDKRPVATDFKIRHALKGTNLWGSYMTDLFKDYDEKSSSNVKKYIQANPDFVTKNIDFFKEELKDLGDVKNLVAFGGEVHSQLNKYFSHDFNIIKIPHYANYVSQAKYREMVAELIGGMD